MDHSKFYCLLDEQPDLLVAQTRGISPDTTGELIVNPYLQILPPGSFPEEIRELAPLASHFEDEEPVAWVGDPFFGSFDPFCIGKKYHYLIAKLQSEGPGSIDLTAETVKTLAIANILIEKKALIKAKRRWYPLQREWRTTFCERGYVQLSRLIHPYLVGSLRRLFRYKIRTGKLTLGDKQCALRYIAYNDPVLRFFHHQLTTIVSRVVNKKIKPSYVYLASYLEGAELPKHVDREQCEYSISFCLDYSPEPGCSETPWPIQLNIGTDVVAIYQKIGDGLLYRGRQIPHYREKLHKDATSTSIFFHFVDETFTGSLR